MANTPPTSESSRGHTATPGSASFSEYSSHPIASSSALSRNSEPHDDLVSARVTTLIKDEKNVDTVLLASSMAGMSFYDGDHSFQPQFQQAATNFQSYTQPAAEQHLHAQENVPTGGLSESAMSTTHVMTQGTEIHSPRLPPGPPPTFVSQNQLSPSTQPSYLASDQHQQYSSQYIHFQEGAHTTPPTSLSQQYVQVQPGQIVTENPPSQAYIPPSTETHVSPGPLPRSSPYAYTPQPGPSSSPRVVRKQLPTRPPSQNSHPQSQHVYSPSPGGPVQMPSGQWAAPIQQQRMHTQPVSQPMAESQAQYAHAHAPLYGGYPQSGPATIQQQPPRQVAQQPNYFQHAQNSPYSSPQAAQNQPVQANSQFANVTQINHQTMQYQQPTVHNTATSYQVSAQPVQTAFHPGFQSQYMSPQHIALKCPVICNHCKKGIPYGTPYVSCTFCYIYVCTPCYPQHPLGHRNHSTNLISQETLPNGPRNPRSCSHCKRSLHCRYDCRDCQFSICSDCYYDAQGPRHPHTNYIWYNSPGSVLEGYTATHCNDCSNRPILGHCGRCLEVISSSDTCLTCGTCEMTFDTPIDLCRKCYFETGNGTQHDPSHKWMQISMQMCTDAAQKPGVWGCTQCKWRSNDFKSTITQHQHDTLLAYIGPTSLESMLRELYKTCQKKPIRKDNPPAAGAQIDWACDWCSNRFADPRQHRCKICSDFDLCNNCFPAASYLHKHGHAAFLSASHPNFTSRGSKVNTANKPARPLSVGIKSFDKHLQKWDKNGNAAKGLSSSAQIGGALMKGFGRGVMKGLIGAERQAAAGAASGGDSGGAWFAGDSGSGGAFFSSGGDSGGGGGFSSSGGDSGGGGGGGGGGDSGGGGGC